MLFDIVILSRLQNDCFWKRQLYILEIFHSFVKWYFIIIQALNFFLSISFLQIKLFSLPQDTIGKAFCIISSVTWWSSTHCVRTFISHYHLYERFSHIAENLSCNLTFHAGLVLLLSFLISCAMDCFSKGVLSSHLQVFTILTLYLVVLPSSGQYISTFFVLVFSTVHTNEFSFEYFLLNNLRRFINCCGTQNPAQTAIDTFLILVHFLDSSPTNSLDLYFWQCLSLNAKKIKRSKLDNKPMNCKVYTKFHWLITTVKLHPSKVELVRDETGLFSFLSSQTLPNS